MPLTLSSTAEAPLAADKAMPAASKSVQSFFIATFPLLSWPVPRRCRPLEAGETQGFYSPALSGLRKGIVCLCIQEQYERNDNVQFFARYHLCKNDMWMRV
jgi:hypothetical protein